MLTGGGAQLKHIKQLVEYITGMDTRIGYPNEHLAGNSEEEISSPLYATAVGLVMNGIENNTQSAIRIDASVTEIKTVKPPVFHVPEVEETVFINDDQDQNDAKKGESTETKIRRSFFDKYVDRIKDFLDNAE